MNQADYFTYVFCPMMAFGIIFLIVQMIRSSIRNRNRPRSVSFVFIGLLSAVLPVCLAIPICNWFEVNLSIETIVSVLIPVVLGLIAFILGSQFFSKLGRDEESVGQSNKAFLSGPMQTRNKDTFLFASQQPLAERDEQVTVTADGSEQEVGH